jgi:hypothetical protein
MWKIDDASPSFWLEMCVSTAVLFAISVVSSPSAAVEGSDVTYTLDMDFDQGTRVNVSDDEDQLRLAMPPTTFPFINVAASARGTMVRINTDTGVIVGEYKTAPETLGLDPSRTTVDGFGNVWAGNRGETSQIEAGGDPYGSVVRSGWSLVAQGWIPTEREIQLATIWLRPSLTIPAKTATETG